MAHPVKSSFLAEQWHQQDEIVRTEKTYEELEAAHNVLPSHTTEEDIRAALGRSSSVSSTSPSGTVVKRRSKHKSSKRSHHHSDKMTKNKKERSIPSSCSTISHLVKWYDRDGNVITDTAPITEEVVVREKEDRMRTKHKQKKRRRIQAESTSSSPEQRHQTAPQVNQIPVQPGQLFYCPLVLYQSNDKDPGLPTVYPQYTVFQVVQVQPETMGTSWRIVRCPHPALRDLVKKGQVFSSAYKAVAPLLPHSFTTQQLHLNGVQYLHRIPFKGKVDTPIYSQIHMACSTDVTLYVLKQQQNGCSASAAQVAPLPEFVPHVQVPKAAIAAKRNEILNYLKSPSERLLWASASLKGKDGEQRAREGYRPTAIISPFPVGSVWSCHGNRIILPNGSVDTRSCIFNQDHISLMKRCFPDGYRVMSGREIWVPLIRDPKEVHLMRDVPTMTMDLQRDAGVEDPCLSPRTLATTLDEDNNRKRERESENEREGDEWEGDEWEEEEQGDKDAMEACVKQMLQSLDETC